MFKGEKRDPLMLILLSIVTCGIYCIYWHYTVGNEINSALGKEAVNPVLAIISFCCFPVLFYYVYTVDKALEELTAERGIKYTSNFVLWVITMLFGIGTLVEMFQVQTTLNEVWEA